MGIEYNYSGATVKKATIPLKSEIGKGNVRYMPILSNTQLFAEIYCDQCYGIRHGDMTSAEWDLHLSEPHNYACTQQKNCPLRFVEESHRQKHCMICESSSLLLATRKEREKNGIGLIDFNKQVPTRKKKKKNKTMMDNEHVWITNYGKAQSYCCSKLRGAVKKDESINTSA